MSSLLSLLPLFLSAAVAPGGPCPAHQAVEAELERLGALTAVAELGTAEVAMRESVLDIVMRDRQGVVLGRRALDAPPGCEARAAVAAVLIAAWAGDWVRTGVPAREGAAPATPVVAPLVAGASAPTPSAPQAADTNAADGPRPTSAPPPAGKPAPGGEAATPAPPPASATPEPVVEAQASKPAPPSPGPTPAFDPALDAALVGSGVHDGDAGTWGLGGQVAVRGRRFFGITLVESLGERERTLSTGRADYGALRVGLGAGARWGTSRGFVEVALVPELARYVLKGKNLTPAHQAVAWGPLADLRVNAGWQLGRWAPFVYLGGSYSMLRERLVLDNADDSVVLSRWNVAAGLGLSFRIRNSTK